MPETVPQRNTVRRVSRRKLAVVVGTRPEAIKMAPVIAELRRRDAEFECVLIVTAQHRDLLDGALRDFGLAPDIDLSLMVPNQSPGDFANRAMEALRDPLQRVEPDMVLVQGDTTTMLTAALSSFSLGLRIAHVEAGLRSFDTRNPYPEEINRAFVAQISDLHFAPTARARENLLKEGVAADDVFVTGNTIVDAVRTMGSGGPFDDPHLSRLTQRGARLVLVTAHRRENHGEQMGSIAEGVRRLLEAVDDIEVVLPVHPNPNVRMTVERELGHVPRVHLVGATTYADLLRLLARCDLVLTDSGGIQEEAPSFGIPILVLRDVTERQELIESGAGRLVGTAPARICADAVRLLCDADARAAMVGVENPFGDGRAAERIVDVLAERV